MLSRAEGLALCHHHPCGLLLQTCSSGMVGPSMQSIAVGTMVKQLGGQRISFALLFYVYFYSSIVW